LIASSGGLLWLAVGGIPGPSILARLVLKIDEARKFVGKPEGMTVEAHHNFTCKGRSYRLTAVEVEKQGEP
jgi:hypothetical protein